jgi:hypothetical protein
MSDRRCPDDNGFAIGGTRYEAEDPLFGIVYDDPDGLGELAGLAADLVESEARGLGEPRDADGG